MQYTRDLELHSSQLASCLVAFIKQKGRIKWSMNLSTLLHNTGIEVRHETKAGRRRKEEGEQQSVPVGYMNLFVMWSSQSIAFKGETVTMTMVRTWPTL